MRVTVSLGTATFLNKLIGNQQHGNNGINARFFSALTNSMIHAFNHHITIILTNPPVPLPNQNLPYLIHRITSS